MIDAPSDNDVSHYLLAEDGRVIQIRPEERTLFGRAEGCSVQLTDDRVSRHHAEVVWNGDGFLLNDLASTNGTRVNGEEIEAKVLADGDIIQIGVGSFIYRRVYSVMELANLRNILRRKNTNMDTSEVESLHSAAGEHGEMAGSLHSAPPAELAQFVATSKRDGLLAIRNGPVKAFLYFEKGELRQADYMEAGGKDLAGDEAALRALRLEKGAFTFTPDRPPTHANVEKELTYLLLETARRADEEARASGQTGGPAGAGGGG